MLIQFHDKSRQPIYIDNEAGQKLKALMMSGVTKYFEIDNCMYAISTIAAVIDSAAVNTTLPGMNPHQKALAAPTTDLSEEKRLENIARIRQMKADFLNRLYKRREEMKAEEAV